MAATWLAWSVPLIMISMLTSTSSLVVRLLMVASQEFLAELESFLEILAVIPNLLPVSPVEISRCSKSHPQGPHHCLSLHQILSNSYQVLDSMAGWVTDSTFSNTECFPCDTVSYLICSKTLRKSNHPFF